MFRDLAVFKLDIAPAAVQHTLKAANTVPRSNDELYYHGHTLINSQQDPSLDDLGLEVFAEYGTFVGCTKQHQAFGTSSTLLSEGMCGGAVISKSGKLVGMIEGIVPKDSELELKGCVGYIPIDVITDFMDTLSSDSDVLHLGTGL